MKTITSSKEKIINIRQDKTRIIFILILSVFMSMKLSFAQTPVKQWAFNDKSTLHPGGHHSGEDWFYACVQAADGGYVGAGYSELDASNFNGSYSASIVKFNNSGKRIWEKAIQENDPADYDFAVDMIENLNGNYIV